MSNTKDNTLDPSPDALKHSHPAARQQALWQLVVQAEPSSLDAVIETLVAALQDEDMSVRFMAVSALGNTNDRRILRAVEPLIAILKRETDPALRFGVANALRKIVHGAANFDDDAARWENWWRQHQHEVSTRYPKRP